MKGVTDMAQKYPFIKVNVSQDEKDWIEELAKLHGMSASAFAKDKLFFTLHGKENETNTKFNYKAESRNVRIETRVSEREMETIKENAGTKTVAQYVRDTALNGSKVINIEVYDDDITDLIQRIQPKVDRILGITKALQMQNKLHDNQYIHLEELLNSIYKDLRSTVSAVRKDRNSIRQTRLRELRRRCNTAIKTGNDSLAHFVEDEEDTNYFEQ